MYKERWESNSRYVFVADRLAYLPLRSISADIAIARMNTVIATRINAIALLNPVEILSKPVRVAF